MKRLGGADWVLWAALACVLVGTLHTEWTLAVQAGWHKGVALTVPGALDLYVVRALQKHRDVFMAMVLMVSVNVLSHLVQAGDVPMHWWIKAFVGGLAPVLLWRIHFLWREHTPVNGSDTMDAAEPQTVHTPVPTTDTLVNDGDWDRAWQAEWEAMTCTPGVSPVDTGPCDEPTGVHDADTVPAKVLTLELPPGFTPDTDSAGVLLDGDWACLGTVSAYLTTVAEEGRKPSIRGLKEFAGYGTDKARRLLQHSGVIA